MHSIADWAQEVQSSCHHVHRLALMQVTLGWICNLEEELGNHSRVLSRRATEGPHRLSS